MKVKVSLGCTDLKIVKFKILRKVSKTNSRITTLDLKRANFSLSEISLADIFRQN